MSLLAYWSWAMDSSWSVEVGLFAVVVVVGVLVVRRSSLLELTMMTRLDRLVVVAVAVVDWDSVADGRVDVEIVRLLMLVLVVVVVVAVGMMTHPVVLTQQSL